MNSATLRKVAMAPAVLAILITAVSTAPAATPLPAKQSSFFCHNPGWPTCQGVLNVLDSNVSYSMVGSPALAVVDTFTDPAKTRNVAWSTIDMKGKLSSGDTISSTLDPDRRSSGTVLSVGNKEFPATATMRFFFKIETQGMRLVSDKPAVFQGIITSIPPANGDKLTLISGPVDFHQEGDPDQTVGALKEAEVVFNNATAGTAGSAGSR